MKNADLSGKWTPAILCNIRSGMRRLSLLLSGGETSRACLRETLPKPAAGYISRLPGREAGAHEGAVTDYANHLTDNPCQRRKDFHP